MCKTSGLLRAIHPVGRGAGTTYILPGFSINNHILSHIISENKNIRASQPDVYDRQELPWFALPAPFSVFRCFLMRAAFHDLYEVLINHSTNVESIYDYCSDSVLEIAISALSSLSIELCCTDRLEVLETVCLRNDSISCIPFDSRNECIV